MDGVMLGRDMSGKDVILPEKRRLEGTYVLGKSGQGKSSLLLNLIKQDMQAGHGVCVLDPHGDLIIDVLALVPALRSDDIILLDMQDTEFPFGFNLFDCADYTDPLEIAQTAELVTAVFKRVWGPAIGARSQDILENAVYALVEVPGTTIADVRPFLTQPARREQLLKKVQDPEIREYWLYEYNALRPAQQKDHITPLLNKIRAFLRNPVLRAIVSQPHAPDFDEILKKKKILLVRFNERMEEASNILGTLTVRRLLHAALARSQMSDRPNFFLYADEFQRFATPDFGTLLQEARKFGPFPQDQPVAIPNPLTARSEDIDLLSLRAIVAVDLQKVLVFDQSDPSFSVEVISSGGAPQGGNGIVAVPPLPFRHLYKGWMRILSPPLSHQEVLTRLGELVIRLAHLPPPKVDVGSHFPPQWLLLSPAAESDASYRYYSDASSQLRTADRVLGELIELVREQIRRARQPIPLTQLPLLTARTRLDRGHGVETTQVKVQHALTLSRRRALMDRLTTEWTLHQQDMATELYIHRPVQSRWLPCSPLLTQVAQERADYCAANRHYEHTEKDGRTFVDRLRATGHTKGRVGENIAWGVLMSVPGAVEGWLNSPPIETPYST